MAKRGPESRTSFESLYLLAEDFYRDFRRLRDGDVRIRIDQQLRQDTREGIYRGLQEYDVRPDEETQQQIEELALKEAIREHRVSDLDVLNSLLNAETAEQVRQICKDAYIIRHDLGDKEILNWPLRDGSALPHYLEKYAEQFVAAKRDQRFPSKDRPSNELKKLWFLARTLAGAVQGIAIRTALNIIGGTRPEQILAHAREGKRKRVKRTRK